LSWLINKLVQLSKISYFCTVKIFDKHISIFLACIIYAASLFSAPYINKGSAAGKGHWSIHKSESLKVSGFTKNEIQTNGSVQNVAEKQSGLNFLSLKESLFIEAFVQKLQTQREQALVYAALVQISKKSLIFPFHTFW
jgi:hypothetical protein